MGQAWEGPNQDKQCSPNVERMEKGWANLGIYKLNGSS